MHRQKFLDKALELTKLISPVFIEGYHSIQHISWKSESDPVTEFDKKIEAISRNFLISQFPDHQVLGEEDGLQGYDSDYQWIIDPIDGTINFIRQIPFVAFSLALSYKGEIIVALIANPITNEVFTAIKGEGAFLNNKKITVSTITDSKKSYLCYGRYKESYAHHYHQLINSYQSVRNTGSAALALAYVATGRLEGALYYKLSLWDFAAGILLVTEAGGVISNINGSKFQFSDPSILACTPHQFQNITRITKQ